MVKRTLLEALFALEDEIFGEMTEEEAKKELLESGYTVEELEAIERRLSETLNQHRTKQ